MNLFFIIFIFSLKILTVLCTPKCEDLTTCNTCVFYIYDDCVWCAADTHNGKRCASKKLTNESWCETSKLMIKSEIEYVDKHDSAFSSGENGAKIVQFRPQKLLYKSASPGSSISFKMYYKPALDAPLRIYFLIDNSFEFAVLKDNLSPRAEMILEEIKNYTNNVRLGIGTFVEKPLLPFAHPYQSGAYSFHNDLSLTDDVEKFKETLKNIPSASNFDNPENVLGGLMDSMTCEEEIGWKTDSHRIIFVYTNGFYHSAGDGKFVGAFERHDMKCHLNTNKDLYMDYPSIGQVSKVAKDKNYLIIFGSTNWEGNSYDQYKLLATKLHRSIVVQQKLADIEKIIKKEFLKAVEEFKVTHNGPSNIEIETKNNYPERKAMHYSEPLELEATIKVVSCPDPPKDKEIIIIKPTTFDGELQVEIEYNCQCSCEKTSLINSTKCNKYGDYQCGVCKCQPDRSGDDCKCLIDSADSVLDGNKCKMNTDDAFRCSGHGVCSCGKCVCNEGYSGLFCQFNDNECPRSNRKLCSGHGKCSMGKCQCFPGWIHSPEGEDCGCTTKQRLCIAPHSDKVCSGNGKCECGRCICSSKEDSNETCSGLYCDRCPWYREQRCNELEGYAYCRYMNKTNCEDLHNMTGTIVMFANRTEINSPKNVQWYMANLCRITKGDDESIFVFKYYYSLEDSDVGERDEVSKLTLVIQKELDEKPPANIWVPVGSAIGGILLVGLLTLLLWKFLTDLYDEREYNLFKEKAIAAGFNVSDTANPAYVPPISTFYNPAHTGDHN